MENTQRTEAWRNERKFRFTGSKISNLLGKQEPEKQQHFQYH